MKRLSFFMLGLSTIAFANASQPTLSGHSALHVAKNYKTFTGKVTANKVRMRLKPDLESHIVKQLQKEDLVLVLGEQDEFYIVAPPKDTKAYIFRSYVLDGVVEANHVNIRLEPHAEGPIIDKLDAGTKVMAQVCPINHKWLEIPIPENVHFYVSKEFIVTAGGPDYLATMEKRKMQANDALNAAVLMASSECKKSYEDMSIFSTTEQLQSLVRNYSDFPDIVHQAKETLALLKETYLNKKITFLEERAQLSPQAKTELLAQHRQEASELLIDTAEQTHPHILAKRQHSSHPKGSERTWEALEESLYLSWTAFHSGKKIDDFYTEQKANALVLSGHLENYPNPVKDKPGNYILRGETGPIAYLYSTHIDLDKYTNEQVTLHVSPRPNNHFAFPAYFVLSIDP